MPFNGDIGTTNISKQSPTFLTEPVAASLILFCALRLRLSAGDISLVVGANEDVRFDASHHTTFKGSAPTATWSSCINPSVAGNDLVGRITFPSCDMTSGTVTLTFNHSWTNSPICFAQAESNYALNPMAAVSVSTTAVTFQAAGLIATGDVISYRCVGYR